MRILFFLYSLGSGGAERVTATLANYWARRGLAVGIVTLCGVEQDFYPLWESVERIPLGLAGSSSTLSTALRSNLRRVRALRRVIRERRPDVVVAMGGTANVLLALASAGLKHGVYIGSERIYPPRMPMGRFWEVQRRYLYRWLTAVVVQTEKVRQWVRQNTRARQVDLIPNPLQYPLPTAEPRLAVHSVVPPQRQILLGAGRLDHQKGFDLLLQAFASVSAAHPDWHLVILGEGDMRSSLELLRGRLRLDERVSLPGRAGNLAEWYENSHLFVLSSRYEGFPNVLLEAMAYGLPSVSFDCDTGPADVVRHGVDGLLVPPENVEALAEALATLMTDEPMRLSLAQRATEVRERFSLPCVASQWEGLFERYLGREVCAQGVG